MAIIEYQEGEHPAGFVGLRVVTTLGTDDTYRQKYFSFNEYSEGVAWHKAQALNEGWREQATTAVKERLVDAHARSGLAWIARGFRGSVRCDKKRRGGEMRRYYTPGFLVDGIPSLGFSHRFFVINHPAGETIADAFHEALYCYSVRRGLSREMIQEIKQRVLPPEVFVELAQKYKRRGCDLAIIQKRVGLA